MSQFTNIMLDLEGLGTRPGCVVTQIGAVSFDLESGTIGESFYRAIRPAAPFTATVETLRWHAEKDTFRLDDDAAGLHPREAILHFLAWLDVKVPCPTEERVFWSWGATYDFPVIEPLLDLRNPEDHHPWEYWQIRDARTIWKLAYGEEKHPDRPHHALEDAQAAVTDLVRAWREVRFRHIQPLLDGLEGLLHLGLIAQSPNEEKALDRAHAAVSAAYQARPGKEAA